MTKPLRGKSARALVMVMLLAMAAAGCKVVPPAHNVESKIHSQKDMAANQEQIRLRMRALVEPLSGAIIASADQIIAGTTNRAVQREALLWKMEAVPALREALFRPNPYMAIMDTWVLTWQMNDYFETGHGHEVLGAAASIAVKTCQDLAAQVEEVTASMTTSGDVTDARKFARQWAREHPIRYSVASRESTLSRVTERELSDNFSIQEIAGNVAVTLADLSLRMDVYSAQMFDQARWQSELVALDLADQYQLDKAMPLAEAAVQSASEAVAIMKRLEPAMNDALAVAKTTPGIIRRERIAALESIAKEREAALTELRQTIAAEREIMLAESEKAGQKVMDHAMLRLAQLAAALLGCLFVGGIVLLLIARRIFAKRAGG